MPPIVPPLRDLKNAPKSAVVLKRANSQYQDTPRSLHSIAETKQGHPKDQPELCIATPCVSRFGQASAPDRRTEGEGLHGVEVSRVSIASQLTRRHPAFNPMQLNKILELQFREMESYLNGVYSAIAGKNPVTHKIAYLGFFEFMCTNTTLGRLKRHFITPKQTS